MNHLLRIVSVVGLTTAALMASAQGDPTTIKNLIDEGKNHNNVMYFMTHIANDIGPRLTSSPRLAAGQRWAVEEFKRMGCTNVHLEQWGEAPVGWDRGPHQSARMLEPYDVDMAFTTPAWTNGTNGEVTAEAIMAPATVADVQNMAAQLKGKWVVMPTATRDKPLDPALVTEVEKSAVGLIYGSRSNLVVTGGTWRDKTFENHPGIVRVTVGKADYDRIVRNLDWKRKVVLAINAENNWYKGPVPQYNVVAEIKGTEKPDEVVIVSGHFDSWNGPGSQGASDNGTGSAVTMECARLLNKVGAKPKRTIRFILWSGEEEGLYGSTAYVKNHADEMDKISAVLVDDGGSNYQGGFDVLETMKPMFDLAVAPMIAAFPDYPQVIRVLPQMPRGGGSDHVPFNAIGVPGFFTIETGKQDYGFVHHTQYDNLEHVFPNYLVQSSTNFAVVSYSLACADTMLPRGPKPAPVPPRAN